MFRQQIQASGMVQASRTSRSKKTPFVLIPKGVKVNKDMCINNLEVWGQPLDPLQGLAQLKLLLARWSAKPQVKYRSKVLKTRFPQSLAEGMWPPSASSLNIMDIAIWSILQVKVCAINHNFINSLESAQFNSWADIGEKRVRAERVTTCIRIYPVIMTLVDEVAWNQLFQYLTGC